MRADGYAYAIIGWALGDFYRRAVGDVDIEGSTPESTREKNIAFTRSARAARR